MLFTVTPAGMRIFRFKPEFSFCLDQNLCYFIYFQPLFGRFCTISHTLSGFLIIEQVLIWMFILMPAPVRQDIVEKYYSMMWRKFKLLKWNIKIWILKFVIFLQCFYDLNEVELNICTLCIKMHRLCSVQLTLIYVI